MMRRWKWIVALVVPFMMSAVDAARACSVCGGEQGSPMVQGAESGVLVMLIVTYTLLLGGIGMMAMLFIRNRHRL